MPISFKSFTSSWVSTNSAIFFMFIPAEKLCIVFIICSFFGSDVISFVIEASIFMVSTSRSERYEKFEYPVPKSSIRTFEP